MKSIYKAVITPLLYLGFHALGLFSEKVRKGIRGRKGLLPKIAKDLSHIDREKIWFHIASYGEFEQAKPLIAKIKEIYPQYALIVSFFSPSAYEHIKLAPPVDYICYLPFDSQKNARKFISIVQPKLAVFVRHDIWPNFIWVLNKKRIPVILIDASIPKDSSRFWPLMRQFNSALFNSFDAIFLTTDDEKERFERLDVEPCKLYVTGDTKFDQVYHRTLETGKVSDLSKHAYIKGKTKWIAGSSWRADEEVIIPAFQRLSGTFDNLLLVIVPHEPSPNRLTEIESRLTRHKIRHIRYSELRPQSTDFSALIIDKIGMLANLYGLGKIAFVGGSFESKVHNVLEPAVYGIPILIGPRINTQAEALLLANHEAALIVKSTDEMVDKVSTILKNDQLCANIGNAAKEIVFKHVGATDRIAKYLSPFIY
jgi:3-deoxy-D-manno-octulosonic-acid transferase